jgi:hypothetical protein
MLARPAVRRRRRVLASASLLLALAVPAIASADPLPAARGVTGFAAGDATPTPTPSPTAAPNPATTPSPTATPSPTVTSTPTPTPTSTPDPEPTPTLSAPDDRPAGDPSRPQEESRGEVLAATDSQVKPPARLTGLAGCVTTPKTVKVTGAEIRSVAFRLDGKALRTVKASSRGVAATKVTVGHLGAGTHTLTAKVTFAGGTNPMTLTLRFSRCTTAKGAPQVTG